ncbi:hypothetical protein FHW36_1056 [Chitinophaga polysaccharea]|uniref:Uncharacterized protein n=1 Tax=Chitinophaga polysaccharea TaxID=1293035 RepID=A0A561PN73_9BACT|nr:hypothetical protein [Chitinophaga polysaccharea]TWF39569.1 hypothetical protein FHW36_1056 [Chitinophaga polysaccharea]
MKKNKSYDAVAEARKIKEKLSVKYWGHPDQLMKDLKAVRKRYSLRLKAAK